jgi:hypothetical protein
MFPHVMSFWVHFIMSKDVLWLSIKKCVLPKGIDKKLSFMSVRRIVSLWLPHISRGRMEHFTQGNVMFSNMMFSFTDTWCS